MLKVMAFLLVIFGTGCNGFVRPDLSGATTNNYFRVFSGFPIPYVYMASAVQWNEDYAVTVRHIPMVADTVHYCSTGCDLVFFRHKNDGRLPHWRAPRVGESITAAGVSPYLLGASGQGKVYATPFLNTDENSGELYAIHDAPLVQGMSGGPVIASDGSVVGINLGIYSTTLNNIENTAARDAKRISIFIPYAVIQREWGVLYDSLTPNNHRTNYAHTASN